jgi:hypothetical protein
VDKHGELIDFMLLDRWDTGAAIVSWAKPLEDDAALATTLDDYRQAWLIFQSNPSAAT